MIFEEVEKEGFVEICAGRRARPRGESVVRKAFEPRSECVVVGWPEGERLFVPTLVIVRGGDIREFLAWATTFLRSWRPISGFMRVVEWRVMRALVAPLKHEVSGEVRRAMLGLVLGEAFLESHGRFRPRRATVRPYSYSLSFTLAQAVSAGYQAEVLLEVPVRWNAARRALERGESRFSQIVEAVWREMLGVSTSRKSSKSAEGLDLHSLVRKAIKGESLVEDIGKGVVGRRGNIEKIIGELSGPREERFEFVRSELVALGKQRERARERSFLAGALVSRVSPGSFEQIDLLGDYLGSMPAAVLWFGLLSGAEPGSEIEIAHGGLGRRIARDFLATVSMDELPRCDIALEELEVLRGLGPRDAGYARTSFDEVVVEVLPGVLTYVRGEAPFEELSPGKQIPLLEEYKLEGRVSQLRRELREIDERLQKARAAIAPFFEKGRGEPSS